MRKTCPICSNEPVMAFQHEFAVPTGWTLPEVNYVKLCSFCGFIWYDNDRTQADYDRYYLERYGYGLDNGDDLARLMNLTSALRAMITRKIFMSWTSAGTPATLRYAWKKPALPMCIPSMWVNRWARISNWPLSRM